MDLTKFICLILITFHNTFNSCFCLFHRNCYQSKSLSNSRQKSVTRSYIRSEEIKNPHCDSLNIDIPDCYKTVYQ